MENVIVENYQVKKKYDVFEISRGYLREFFKYIIEETDIKTKEAADSLFIYCIEKIWYGKRTIDVDKDLVKKYGKGLIAKLKELGKGKLIYKRFSRDDREKMVEVAKAYLNISNITGEKMQYFREINEDEE